MNTGPIETPPEIRTRLEACENGIEAALTGFEAAGQLEQALQAYWQVELDLDGLGLEPQDPAYPAMQAVLAQCLLRQANILRQFGQVEQAAELSRREIAAARASNDALTLARSLVSIGATRIVHGELETGLASLEEARQLFETGEGDDYRQGLGWYWIVLADLDNARITSGGPEKALEAAARALTILEPLANWPGVARAWAARAIAAEALGDRESLLMARQAEAEARARISS